MTHSMVRLSKLTIDTERIEVSTMLEGHPERWFDSLRSLTIVLSVVEARWFDSLRSLTIVLSVVEARLKGVEG